MHVSRQPSFSSIPSCWYRHIFGVGQTTEDTSIQFTKSDYQFHSHCSQVAMQQNARKKNYCQGVSKTILARRPRAGRRMGTRELSLLRLMQSLVIASKRRLPAICCRLMPWKGKIQTPVLVNEVSLTKQADNATFQTCLLTCQIKFWMTGIGQARFALAMPNFLAWIEEEGYCRHKNCINFHLSPLPRLGRTKEVY